MVGKINTNLLISVPDSGLKNILSVNVLTPRQRGLESKYVIFVARSFSEQVFNGNILWIEPLNLVEMIFKILIMEESNSLVRSSLNIILFTKDLLRKRN
jgi:hypothetical protein